MSWSKTRQFEDVGLGEALPPLELPLTVTGIVAAAIATRDFQNVHHDLDATKELGSPNIFMNILTSNAYVERYVTGWAGPEAFLKSVSIKLGAPNFPGDTMTLSGEVNKVGEGGERWVEIAIKGKNAFGNHLTGTARLQLP